MEVVEAAAVPCPRPVGHRPVGPHPASGSEATAQNHVIASASLTGEPTVYLATVAGGMPEFQTGGVAVPLIAALPHVATMAVAAAAAVNGMLHRIDMVPLTQAGMYHTVRRAVMIVMHIFTKTVVVAAAVATTAHQ